MKKVLCTAVAALLVTGSLAAFAGECPCSKKKADKDAETTAQQQPAATTEAPTSA